jgi:predicted dehydrogenase
LSDPRVDAVVIALPTGMHAEVAEAALEAGKHVYLEKPLAANVEDARRVVEAWERSNRVGMIGFNYRFNPLYARIKRQIDAGRVGQVICVRTVFSTRAANLPNWKKSRAGGGGVLLDLGSHHFDLLRFMFGEIDQVEARIESIQTEDDTAAVSMRLGGSILCESFFSLASAEEDRIEVYGREGKTWADRCHSAAVSFEPPQGRGALLHDVVRGFKQIPAKLARFARRGAELSYTQALARFVEAARTGTNAAPDFRDGLRSLEIIEAAEESARPTPKVSV